MDEALPADLQRVGRWFWLSLAVGGVAQLNDVPLLQPFFVLALVWALDRLGRSASPEARRPDPRIPIAAASLACISRWVSLLPGVPAAAVPWAIGAGMAAMLIGVDVYLRELAALVRSTGRDVPERMQQGLRRWRAATAVALGVIVGWLLTLRDVTDGTSSDALSGVDWTSAGWLPWIATPTVMLVMHRLYRAADAHWTVVGMAERAHRPTPAAPGFQAPGASV
jgi:hypothetical protein